MVYVISQEYVDGFGKNSTNIINFANVIDLKIVEDTADDMSTSYVICYDIGGLDRFICKSESLSDAKSIVQSLINAQITREPHSFIDISEIQPKKITTDYSIDEIHDLILDVCEQAGYGKLVQLYEFKIEEEEKKLINNDNTENPNNAKEETGETTGRRVGEPAIGTTTTTSAPYTSTESETVRVSYM